MFGVGSTELFFILVIVLVLFGAKKVPDLLGGLGKGIRAFKKGMNDDDDTPDAQGPTGGHKKIDAS